MVQHKYFGDSRDYFKYDLIKTVLENTALRHYVFIPMLTEHRDDAEGKVSPKDRGDKSPDLLHFIRSCDGKSLKHWRSWVARFAESYSTVEPVDETYFSDEGRETYWKRYDNSLSTADALVFVDPDTGLETGGPSYLRKMGREKYILNPELRTLIEGLDQSSVLMLYQHLPPNKHLHRQSVDKKLAQVCSVSPLAKVCAYREDDLAFLFVSKSESRHQEIRNVLVDYDAGSAHAYKSIHACSA